MRTLVIAALALMVSAAGTDAWQKGQKERKPVTHTVTVDATGPVFANAAEERRGNQELGRLRVSQGRGTHAVTRRRAPAPTA